MVSDMFLLWLYHQNMKNKAIIEEPNEYMSTRDLVLAQTIEFFL